MADILAADGPVGPAAHAIPRPAAPAAAEVQWGHADAEQRWSLVAGASRGERDPGALAARGFARLAMPAHFALPADASHARLALDWQRGARGGRIHAGAFAARDAVELSPDPASSASALDERLRLRDERTRFGASAGVQQRGLLLGMPSTRALTVRFAGEARDWDGRLVNAYNGAASGVHDDRVRQSATSIEASGEILGGGRVRAHGAASLQRFAVGLDSRDVARAGAFDGTLAAARGGVEVRLAPAASVFAEAAHGLPADDAPALAAVDPRSGQALPVLDPRARTTFGEVGVRARSGAAEARLSAFRAASAGELRFTGEEAWSAIARAGLRDGLRASVRYDPAPWLTLDLDAHWLRARFGDGGGEPIAYAAERLATAGATLRGAGGWTASLFVSYLGPRPAADDEALRMRSSTSVNARVLHRLSKRTRLTFDVFNVFNQRVGDIDHFAASRLAAPAGSAENYLFHPAEPRGFRLRLRTTF